MNVAAPASRLDPVTIAFHWITAILVLALFATAMAWTYAPRDWGLRSLQSVHVSLGIALAMAIVGRMVWRITAGRRLPPVGSTTTKVLAKVVHFGLYGLLILQVALGFGLQWFSGDALSFFGLFSIASPFAEDRNLGNQMEGLHQIVAWSLMIVAFGHAAAALVHQYILKDNVLGRMIPALASRQP